MRFPSPVPMEVKACLELLITAPKLNSPRLFWIAGLIMVAHVSCSLIISRIKQSLFFPFPCQLCTWILPPLASQIAARGSALTFATRALPFDVDNPAVTCTSMIPRVGEQAIKSANPNKSRFMNVCGMVCSTEPTVQPSLSKNFRLAFVAENLVFMAGFVSEQAVSGRQIP